MRFVNSAVGTLHQPSVEFLWDGVLLICYAKTYIPKGTELLADYQVGKGCCALAGRLCIASAWQVCMCSVCCMGICWWPAAACLHPALLSLPGVH